MAQRDAQYEVVIRALGAESVPAPAGTNISFAWTLDDIVTTTPPETTELDGFVEWDAICKMRCLNVDGQTRRLCSFKLITSPQEEGQPSELVCETAIDLYELCMAGPTPTHYTIDLYPAGRLHLSICAHREISEAEAADLAQVESYLDGYETMDGRTTPPMSDYGDGVAAELSIITADTSPELSPAQEPRPKVEEPVVQPKEEQHGGVDITDSMAMLQVTEVEEVVSDDGDDTTAKIIDSTKEKGAMPTVIVPDSDALLKQVADINAAVAAAVEGGDAGAGDTVAADTPMSRHTDGSFHSWLDRSTDADASTSVPSISTASEAPNSAKVADSEASSHMFDGTYGTPMSQFSGPLNGDGPPATNDLGAVLKVLKKKVQRLTQAREEARAESFAQASIAVQRGIEIDNLKRAKDMLLRRLEVAESELLASCQRASDAPSDSSDSGAAGSAGEPKDSELLAALVGAKVEVAQKDYAIMELQGALKHSEARVKSLEAQLQLANEANASLAQVTSPRFGGGSWWSPRYATFGAKPSSASNLDTAPLGRSLSDMSAQYSSEMCSSAGDEQAQQEDDVASRDGSSDSGNGGRNDSDTIANVAIKNGSAGTAIEVHAVAGTVA